MNYKTRSKKENQSSTEKHKTQLTRDGIARGGSDMAKDQHGK